MKKEKIITSAFLMALGICVLMINGCGNDKKFYELYLEQMKDKDKTVEEVYVVNQMGKLKENSDCLSCIGCVNMRSSCFSNAGYYGCIDCFGATIDEDAEISDLFSEKKIYGGLCGSSCLSCYWVNFPLLDSDGDVKPAYGCMIGE